MKNTKRKNYLSARELADFWWFSVLVVGLSKPYRADQVFTKKTYTEWLSLNIRTSCYSQTKQLRTEHIINLKNRPIPKESPKDVGWHMQYWNHLRRLSDPSGFPRAVSILEVGHQTAVRPQTPRTKTCPGFSKRRSGIDSQETKSTPKGWIGNAALLETDDHQIPF